jgi:hypothetical protein
MMSHARPMAKSAAPPTNAVETPSRHPRAVRRAIGNQAALRTLRQQAVPFLERRLEIGGVDDPLEHEADRVAAQVMRMTDPDVSVRPASPQLSRKCAACEQEEELQRKPVGPSHAAAPAPAIVHEVLRSPGAPLDAPTREFMEPRFSRDFGDVRVHADARAAESAHAVDALAYTVGRDIVFGRGQYLPRTDTGRRVLAHELAHVLQQRDAAQGAQRLDRWKIDGNVATVNDKSDFLWTLAEKYGDPLDWPCIWPLKMQAKNIPDDHYEAYLLPGDTFDISNIAGDKKVAKTATFTLKPDQFLHTLDADLPDNIREAKKKERADEGYEPYNIFLEAMATIYKDQEKKSAGGGVTQTNVLDDIKDASSEGGTPISSMTVTGHGGLPAMILGYGSVSLDISGLPQASKPKLSNALQNKGPRRCWFTRNASTRFVGCTSQGFAKTFAKSFLRKGAQAFGSTRWLCGAVDLVIGRGTGFIAFFISNDKCKEPKSPSQDLFTPADIEGTPDWQSVAGSL